MGRALKPQGPYIHAVLNERYRELAGNACSTLLIEIVVLERPGQAVATRQGGEAIPRVVGIESGSVQHIGFGSHSAQGVLLPGGDVVHRVKDMASGETHK